MLFCQNCGNKIGSGSSFCDKCGTPVEGAAVGTVTAIGATQIDESVYEVSQRNKKIGIWLIVGPIAGLFLIVMAYAIATFVINSLVASTDGVQSVGASSVNATDVRITIANIIRTVMGLLGIACVLGAMLGTPLGIILMLKKELKTVVPYDQRSGNGNSSTVPEGIRGWNWGAAGLGPIWGVYHNVWISLLAYIPYVNFVWWIVMGINGNEWAWKNNKWRSEQDFVYFQNKWKPWGIAFIAIGCITSVLGMLSALSK